MSEVDEQAASDFQGRVRARMVDTAAKPLNRAISAVSTAWNWLATVFNRSEKVVIVSRGETCTFRWNGFLVKVPDQGTALFEAEVATIEALPKATRFGFVPASVIETGPDMIKALRRAVPFGIESPERAIVMSEPQGGVCPLHVAFTQLDPHIISAAIIDSNSRLASEGWYNTNCRLDTIKWFSATGEVRFLDWGSLSPASDKWTPRSFWVEGHYSSAKVCMSITVLLSILELFGSSPPINPLVTVARYRAAREEALALLAEPYRERLSRLVCTLV